MGDALSKLDPSRQSIACSRNVGLAHGLEIGLNDRARAGTIG